MTFQNYLLAAKANVWSQKLVLQNKILNINVKNKSGGQTWTSCTAVFY